MDISVLFVDDSELARVVARSRLEKLGIAVTTLRSSREASRVDAVKFSAALLDIELGDGLGTELAQRLRLRVPGMPIAFLTAGTASPLVDVAQMFGPVFSKTGGFDEAMAWVAQIVGAARSGVSSP